MLANKSVTQRDNINSPNTVFPKLPLLQSITNKVSDHLPDLSDFILIAGQHALDTTGSLLEWLRDICQLPMMNVFMVGKSYSNSNRVITKLRQYLKINYQPNSEQTFLGGFSEAYDYDIIKLWEKVALRLEKCRKENKKIKGVLILDDGGHIFNRMIPRILKIIMSDEMHIPVIGIEQTSSGVFSSRSFLYPVIEVATSAAKQLEASMLAELVATQLKTNICGSLSTNNIPFREEEIDNLTYGIVGLGNIGTSLLSRLRDLGYQNIIVYDSDSSKSNTVNFNNITVIKNLFSFLKKADVILGCTGKNFLGNHFLECLKIIERPRKIPRIFVSLSSKDSEFNSLLVKIHQDTRNGPINHLHDILYPKTNPNSIILAAGMPVNFHRVNSGLCDYSIPHEDIQLTRGLLATAVIQAYSMIELGYSRVATQYQLDPYWQRYVVLEWLELTNKSLIPEFTDLKWIEKNSGGETSSPTYMKHYFEVE